MIGKKNYLKYYKTNYLKKEKGNFNAGKTLSILSAVIIMFIFTVFIFYIIIGDMNTFTDEKDEIETNQVVSIRKKGLRTDFNAWNKTCDWNLIIINNFNPLPDYFSPSLKQYGGSEIDERIISELSEMIQMALIEDVHLWISSGYRTMQRQEQLFNKELEENINNGLSKSDAEDQAMRILSKPGNNEHNLGLSVDFNAGGNDFNLTKEYEWLLENSVNYGFILRYAKDKEHITGRAFEPAHFRYVGEEHAKIMKSQNLCLEEYISTLIK